MIEQQNPEIKEVKKEKPTTQTQKNATRFYLALTFVFSIFAGAIWFGIITGQAPVSQNAAYFIALTPFLNLYAFWRSRKGEEREVIWHYSY